MKIDKKSSKNDVWGVPEALGRGLGAIWAPKCAPGTKSMPKGHSASPPRGPSWELFGIKNRSTNQSFSGALFEAPFGWFWPPFWLLFGVVFATF